MAIVIPAKQLPKVKVTKSVDLKGETDGGYVNHIFKLRAVIRNMLQRGVPIDPTILDSMHTRLEIERVELNKSIYAHIDEVVKEKKKLAISDYVRTDYYKTLPPPVRKRLDEMAEVTSKMARRKNKETGKFEQVEVEVRTLPQITIDPEAKYPTFYDDYQDWFKVMVTEMGYQWVDDIENYALTSFIADKREFNPDSPKQIMEYCRLMGYTVPSREKKSKTKGREVKDTTDDKALEELMLRTKDPVFEMIQQLRENGKLDGTYVEGWRPNGADGRLHSTFKFKPATGQLSSTNPNIQNAHKMIKTAVVAREGRVILNCVAPGTKVLMKDLSWKNAEDVLPGDELIGFDEELTPKTRRRYFRHSVAEAVTIQPSKRLLLITDMGNIIVSPDHKFMQRLQGRGKWVEARKLRAGNKINFFTKPWETLTSYEGGWLAGFLDGEGYIGNGPGSKGNSTTLGFGQNDGAASIVAQRLLAMFGYVLSVSGKRRCKQYAVLSGKSGIPYSGIRAVGQFRPVRLLPKVIDMMDGLATWGTASKSATIQSIRRIKDGPVVAIKTSTKTLITNGFLSHNCDYTGYHAQLLGYLAGDPLYMRLSVLGIHDFLAANILRVKLDQQSPETQEHLQDLPKWLTLEDKLLKAKLKWIKSNHPQARQQAKSCVHGIGFGMGVRKFYDMNRSNFSSLKEAEEVRGLMRKLFPKIFEFQDRIVEKAYQDKCLVSPYGYVRRFWEAKVWRNGQMVKGEDAEKAIAFLPANTAFAIKKEALLRLEEMGANEQFWLWNEVHDSVMYEPEEKDLDEAIRLIVQEMTRPVMRLANEICPQGLKCAVEVSVGKSWDKLEVVQV